MRQAFLLIALLFTGFMCCKIRRSKQLPNPRLATAAPAHGLQPSPTAESLEVSRDRFKRLAAECRATLQNRNGSLEVIQPLNPTHEILSKTNRPPQ